MSLFSFFLFGVKICMQDIVEENANVDQSTIGRFNMLNNTKMI